MKKRPALGRSISNLVSDPTDILGDLTRREGSLLHISIDSLAPNPFQPRSAFDDEALAELVESVQRNGVLQPVLVRPQPDRPNHYQLIAGHRRLEAARRAGLATLPAIVHHAEDETLLEIALIENLQRENLNPIDEALAYQKLIETLHYRHEDIAERIGKSRVHVTNMLRLLNLPPQAKEELRNGTIQAGHARALLALEDAGTIVSTLRNVLRNGLSVRATENLVRHQLEDPERPATKARRRRELDPELTAVQQALQHALGTRVQIRPSGKSRGQIRIDYYNLDDFDRILDRLGLSLE